VHLGVREMQAVFTKVVTKKNEKEKKRRLIHVQFSTDNKLATTQDRHPLNSDEKQYCQYWIPRLVVFTRFRASRDCLLKFHMLGKSAKTVSHELYREKRVRIAIASYWFIAEGVATIICCCAKLVFMLFTIGLWHKAGLLKLLVVTPNGVAKCNFGVSKPIGLTNQL